MNQRMYICSATVLEWKVKSAKAPALIKDNGKKQCQMVQRYRSLVASYVWNAHAMHDVYA